jgi:hypothetical protein
MGIGAPVTAQGVIGIGAPVTANWECVPDNAFRPIAAVRTNSTSTTTVKNRFIYSSEQGNCTAESI